MEKGGRVEQAPENGKESSHSAHANGMNEWNDWLMLFKIATQYGCALPS